MKVLVIDDNPLNLRLVAAMLEPFGHQVRMVNAPETAVEAALDFHPDVVLLDIAMPGRDGIAVMRDLRACPQFRRTPIHALTAHAVEELHALVADGAFTSIVRKPCSKDRLLSLVEQGATVG